MQSPELSSEIAFMQRRIETLTQAFDQAVANDVKLGELKKIFHEIRVWRDKLEKLNDSMQKNSE
jgi:predicted  nucleic acid-binding Zn-ribbon protein